LQNRNKYSEKAENVLDKPRFLIELPLETKQPIYDVLLDAIDESFSSFGEASKKSIYHFLELKGIKKEEIPYRIEDFQNALEQLLGLGARSLEILFIKNLHEKVKATYKWNMPSLVIPELTFKDYLKLIIDDFEKANSANNSDEAEKNE
jgi:hypothetical protein